MTKTDELSAQQVINYRNQFPELMMIFSGMEKIENWAVKLESDAELLSEIRSRFKKLQLDQVDNLDAKTDNCLWICFFLSVSSSFYILDIMRDFDQNIDTRLLNRSVQIMNDPSIEDKRHAQVFIDRARHLNTSGFISAVLSDQFHQSIDAAIRDTIEEKGNVYKK
jgi:hypothetical protein